MGHDQQGQHEEIVAVVDRLEEVWGSTAEATQGLDEAQWALPSELPGWTVKDVLSHVAGTEASLLGRPSPPVDVSHRTHVVTPFQEMLEVAVEHLRPLSGREVREHFLDMTRQRVARMRAMTDEEMSAPSPSPIGEVPYFTFMQVRVFDCWMHEQDIRRVVGRPGHLEGPVVDVVLDRFRDVLGYLVARKAGAPAGSTVLVRTTGPTEVDLAVAVEERARLVDPAELGGEATATVTLPFEAFVALGGGRWDRATAEQRGGVVYAGDVGLGRQVVGALAFTP